MVSIPSPNASMFQENESRDEFKHITFYITSIFSSTLSVKDTDFFYSVAWYRQIGAYLWLPFHVTIRNPNVGKHTIITEV